MNPLWTIGGIMTLFVAMLLIGSAVLGAEKRYIRRTGRRLAEERAGDTSDSFAEEMERSGVSRDVSLALYAEMGRALEGYGIHAFPARPDDHLRGVYGIGLPDEDNELMDTDLREIARGAAKRSGRRVTLEGDELDKQLMTLSTVRDLGKWLSSLSPRSF